MKTYTLNYIPYHMRVSRMPTKEWLEELFEYRPEDGLFWKLRPESHFTSEVDWYIWNKRFARKMAGTNSKKKSRSGVVEADHSRVQLPVCFGGKLKTFSVHRIAFAMMGVEVPKGMIIDHINNDRRDNRWANLRVGTHQQNTFNTKGWKRRKHDLPKGVYLDPRRPENPYYAMVKAGQKYRRLSYHPTIEAALADYKKMAKELHGEFLNSKSVE